MLKKILVGVLVSMFLFGIVSAWSPYWWASQEWIDAVLKRDTAISEVSEICWWEEKYNYIDNKVIISRVNKKLDTYTYDQIKTIQSKLHDLNVDIEQELDVGFNGNITKYNKRYIDEDSYDKGYEFLLSNYEYDDGEMNYILWVWCNPYVLLIWTVGNNVFTQESDYQRYKLITWVSSIIADYMQDNYYPSRKYEIYVTLYSENWEKLGEKKLWYGSLSSIFWEYVFNKEDFEDIMTKFNWKRLNEVLNEVFTNKGSWYKWVPNSEYDERCFVLDIIQAIDWWKMSDCGPEYFKEDIDFIIETRILPKD